MEKEKKVHFRDWEKLNWWRWEFLRISKQYQDFFYNHEEKPEKNLDLKCLLHFNLVLTDKFRAKNTLPDPSMRSEQQIEEPIFYDYYYPLRRKSLMMAQVLGKGITKACIDTSGFKKEKIDAIRKWQSFSSIQINDSTNKYGASIFSPRIIPGLVLFAVDLNTPVEELTECFKREIELLR